MVKNNSLNDLLKLEVGYIIG